MIVEALQIQVDLLRTIAESKERLGRQESSRAHHPGKAQAQPGTPYTVDLPDDQSNALVGARLRGFQGPTWQWPSADRNDPANVRGHETDAAPGRAFPLEGACEPMGQIGAVSRLVCAGRQTHVSLGA